MNRPKNPIFKYALYARRSSEYEDSQIQSIQRQIDELGFMVDREGLATFDECLCESRSAFHPGREEFAKLVKWTMEGKVNAWLCWHANRLSRNPVDSGTILYLMDQGKLHHVRTHERIYYNTPGDKFNLQIDLGVSKRDSDDKSALVKSGILRRHRRGYPNGFPPVGFKLLGQARSGHSFWVVDQERMKLVRQVYSRYLEGKDSLKTICQFASKIGLATPVRAARGGRPLSVSAIRRNLLCNTVYAGFFFSKDGQRYELDETLPRAITEEQLERIHEILGSKMNYPTDQKKPRPAAYRGLLSDPAGAILGVECKFQLICDCRKKFAYLNRQKCPACEAPIKRLAQPKYLTYTYYFSIRDRRNRFRTAKVIEEKKIDEFLIENLAKKIRISPQLRDWAVSYLRYLDDGDLESRNSQSDRSDEFKARYAEKRKRLRQLFLSGKITEEEFNADALELDEVFAEKSGHLAFRESLQTDIEKIFNLATELENILKSNDAEAKNQAIRNSCSNLTWDGNSLFIHNEKRMNVLIETLKSAKEKSPAFEPEKCVDTSSRNALFKTVQPILCRGIHSIRT